MRFSEINPKSIDRLTRSANIVYRGTDSDVIRVGDYCVHRYKNHIDTTLFCLYHTATDQSRNTLSGTHNLTSLAVPVVIEVIPILASFVSEEGNVCSVTEWVDWQSGDDLKRDYKYSHLVLAVVELANSYLRYPHIQIMGIEVVPQNTRFLFTQEKVNCKITDVGNSLRYLRSSSHW